MLRSLITLAWLTFAAHAVHILEEYAFDWRNWARGVVSLRVEWNDFYMTNALLVVLGLIQAELALRLAIAPLTFAALMLIDARFFHVLKVVRARGRFSPGLVTATPLFYPIGTEEFVRAHGDGLLSSRATFSKQQNV